MKTQLKGILGALLLIFGQLLTSFSQSATLSADGVYVPRLTTSQRNALATPTNGQLVYNTDDGCFNVYQVNGWQKLCGSNTGLSDKWTQKADFGGGIRLYGTGFSIGNKGYAGTGITVSFRQKDFWEYDPATNAWTQKADFGGTARSGAVGFSIGAKGYIGTGAGGGQRRDFWEYDPATNLWTQKADFGGTARMYATGFYIGNKGYIGTGLDGNYKKDFWEYDPGSNTWTQKNDFGGLVRTEAVGFSIGQKGYLGTGIGNSSLLKDFWEYTPTTDTWLQKMDFGGVSRFGAFGFSIANKGYIGTGSNIANSQEDFWEYDPQFLDLTNQGNTFNGANQLLRLNATAGFDVTGTSKIAGTGGGKTWQTEVKANDANAHVELRQMTGGGLPYLDFSNDNAIDFDGRLILVSDTELQMSGGAPGFKLNVLGNVQSNGTNLSSDARYKKNLTPIEDPLSKVLQINGLSYEWRREQFPEKNFDDRKQLGFIAQDLEQILPEVVHTDSHGFKSVDYAKVTPLLVEALKELKKENEYFKKELEALKSWVMQAQKSK